jgi:hypothetical protein
MCRGRPALSFWLVEWRFGIQCVRFQPGLDEQRFSPCCGLNHHAAISSMNDLVYHAQFWILEGGLSPFDACWKLNEMPMSYVNHRYPREALKSLADASSPLKNALVAFSTSPSAEQSSARLAK